MAKLPQDFNVADLFDTETIVQKLEDEIRAQDLPVTIDPDAPDHAPTAYMGVTIGIACNLDPEKNKQAIQLLASGIQTLLRARAPHLNSDLQTLNHLMGDEVQSIMCGTQVGPLKELAPEFTDEIKASFHNAKGDEQFLTLASKLKNQTDNPANMIAKTMREALQGGDDDDGKKGGIGF